MGGRGLPAQIGASGSNESGKDIKYDAKAVGKALSYYIQQHRDAPIENGYALTRDGRQISASKGDETSVHIYGSTDHISVHNHPKQPSGYDGGPFSDADVRLAIYRNEYMSVAFDQSRVYILKKIGWKEGDRPLDATFAMKYKAYADKSYDRAQKITTRLYNEGAFKKENGLTDWKKYEQSNTKEWFRMLRSWLKSNSKKYGFEYHEHKISEKDKTKRTKEPKKFVGIL